MKKVHLGFWENLKKPVMVLAPMADVTDAAFRRVICKYGKPDVTWTEFVSADGLCRATKEGKAKLMRDLLYTEAERPIVAQLFSANPEYMYEAAKLCASLGFDGIDINMGCPDKGIEKQGAGAAMIKNPEGAKAIIRAAIDGAHIGSSLNERNKKLGTIPVTVKTRIGFNKDELATWLPEILSEGPAVVTIHARTRKEMSLVPANWNKIKEAVEIRNSLGSQTLIFGNGDVKNLDEAHARVTQTGCDGVMIGRGIFGTPWLFNNEMYTKGLSLPQRLQILIEHTKLFDELLGDIKNFAIMKKHFKAYVTGFDNAKEIREELMQTNNAREVEEVIQKFLAKL